MFERFTHDARTAVILAQEAARDRGDGFIGNQHLLLAVAMTPGAAADALAQHGLDVATVAARIESAGADDRLDPEALRSVGIDLDEIRRRTEDSFGPGALDEPATDQPQGRGRRGRRSRGSRAGGHIPFTEDAKQSLNQSLLAALHLGHRQINSSHLALGILACGSGTGGRILTRAATPALRVSLEAAARPAA